MNQSSATDQPPLPVLIFDGDCAFCTTSARWGQRRLQLPRVEPWQALDLDEFGLTEQQCSQAVQWVDRDGSARSGHRAVAAALRSAGKGWRPLGVVMEWPVVSPVMGVVYRIIAKNRHRLPGATDACRLP